PFLAPLVLFLILTYSTATIHPSEAAEVEAVGGAAEAPLVPTAPEGVADRARVAAASRNALEAVRRRPPAKRPRRRRRRRKRRRRRRRDRSPPARTAIPMGCYSLRRRLGLRRRQLLRRYLGGGVFCSIFRGEGCNCRKR